MAAVLRSVCDHNFASRRPFAPARLAVAVILSTIVHLWLVAGMAVDAPMATAPHGPTITARLELSATPPAMPLPPQTETGAVEEIAREDARPRGRPIPDDQPKSSATIRSSAPNLVAGVSETRTADPVLQQPADPVYYSARQLDVYPALLHPVRPEYPKQSSQNKAGGRVLLTLLIDETGSVNEVAVAEAEPAGYLEGAVRRAFASARFSPARKDGHVVKSRVMISVSYNPGEAEGTVR